MIDRVPEQVNQWVADLVEQRAIEFDLPAFDHEVQFLPQGPCRIAHDSWEPIEDLPHRNHAAGEDPALHLADEARHGTGRILQYEIVMPGNRLIETATGDDQLTHQV